MGDLARLSEELVKVFSRPISELLTRLTCLVMAVVVEYNVSQLLHPFD